MTRHTRRKHARSYISNPTRSPPPTIHVPIDICTAEEYSDTDETTGDEDLCPEPERCNEQCNEVCKIITYYTDKILLSH